MTDPEKLRALADWLALTMGDGGEVQADLRRIADRLECGVCYDTGWLGGSEDYGPCPSCPGHSP